MATTGCTSTERACHLRLCSSCDGNGGDGCRPLCLLYAPSSFALSITLGTVCDSPSSPPTDRSVMDDPRCSICHDPHIPCLSPAMISFCYGLMRYMAVCTSHPSAPPLRVRVDVVMMFSTTLLSPVPRRSSIALLRSSVHTHTPYHSYASTYFRLMLHPRSVALLVLHRHHPNQHFLLFSHLPLSREPPLFSVVVVFLSSRLSPSSHPRCTSVSLSSLLLGSARSISILARPRLSSTLRVLVSRPACSPSPSPLSSFLTLAPTTSPSRGHDFPHGLPLPPFLVKLFSISYRRVRGSSSRISVPLPLTPPPHSKREGLRESSPTNSEYIDIYLLRFLAPSAARRVSTGAFERRASGQSGAFLFLLLVLFPLVTRPSPA
ncbi:hypothetical protein C8Q80DRAFT_945770 [Daedaleopsis nitida]|nr:hypothetical protein C8Q80DRAFT_945770 [Daedaleopsis nitida]